MIISHRSIYFEQKYRRAVSLSVDELSQKMCRRIVLSTIVLIPYISSKKRNFYRGDYKTANSTLLEIDWNVMDDMNVEQCWNYFSENVKTVLNDTIRERSGSEEECLTQDGFVGSSLTGVTALWSLSKTHLS